VRLSQTAVRVPGLTRVVLEVAEESDEARAAAVAEGVRRRLVRPMFGRLDDTAMLAVSRALVSFLGLE
jgi:hypothetical protein